MQQHISRSNYLKVASSGLRLLLQLRARAAHGYGDRNGQEGPPVSEERKGDDDSMDDG